MQKKLTVRELIKSLLDFNPDALVQVNATGTPEDFDIVWFDDGGEGCPSKKEATEVLFDAACPELK